jgi:endonuclease YncB( thermonuclease family)
MSMHAAMRLLLIAFLCTAVGAAPDPLAIGDFKLTKVVDGDTIRVDGLDNSLRLLGIDTEETFKHDKERRAYAKGWKAYLVAQRGDSPHPVKMATPLGDAAKVWAEQWFAGASTVRLERDDPQEIRDRYGRYLAYVLVLRDGAWLNYNVEAVRAGMSPYFPKYGRSRRFHDQFVAAEAEAKKAKRGIWAPGAEAYPDYPEREAWWTARGDFVDAFRKTGGIDLTHEDAIAQLEASVGKDVTLIGTIDELHHPRIELPHRFALVAFDHKIFDGLHQGEYVIATGKPSMYKGHVQLVIERASQLRVQP